MRGQVYVLCLLIRCTKKGTSLTWHSCQICITHLAWPVEPVWGNPQSWDPTALGWSARHGSSWGTGRSSAPARPPSTASPTLKAHTQTASRRLQGTRLSRDSEAKGGVSGGRRVEGFLGLHRLRQVLGGRRGEP